MNRQTLCHATCISTCSSQLKYTKPFNKNGSYILSGKTPFCLISLEIVFTKETGFCCEELVLLLNNWQLRDPLYENNNCRFSFGCSFAIFTCTSCDGTTTGVLLSVHTLVNILVGKRKLICQLSSSSKSG